MQPNASLIRQHTREPDQVSALANLANARVLQVRLLRRRCRLSDTVAAALTLHVFGEART